MVWSVIMLPLWMKNIRVVLGVEGSRRIYGCTGYIISGGIHDGVFKGCFIFSSFVFEIPLPFLTQVLKENNQFQGV